MLALNSMLDKAIQSAQKFLRDDLHHKESSLLGAGKVEGGWEVKFEVVEKDNYIAKIVPGATTHARNVYAVVVDSSGKITSFENFGQRYTHPHDEAEESE